MELNFKTKFKHADFDALKKVIEYILLNLTTPTIEEKLMLASLAEIHLSIRKKMIDHRLEYKLTLTAAQAIAIRLMYLLYMQKELKKGELLPSLDNKMLMVCTTIDQQYKIYDERTKL